MQDVMTVVFSCLISAYPVSRILSLWQQTGVFAARNWISDQSPEAGHQRELVDEFARVTGQPQPTPHPGPQTQQTE